MTAAAMTYSSFCVPRPCVAAFRRADATAPLMAARMPIRTNVFMIVRRVLMPAELGGLRVAADGEDVAAEAAARREERHDERDADGDQHRDGDAGRDDQAALRDRDAVLLRVLRARSRPGVAVGDPDRAEHDRAADDPEQ